LIPQDIRDIRNELSMTQQEFADHILVSISSVRAWEQGTRLITPRLARIVRDSSLRGHKQTIKVKKGETITIVGI